MQVVRAFGQQLAEQERFDEASTDLMRTQLFTNRVMTFMMPTIFMIMNIVSIAIVWVGAGQVDAGAIQTGDLIAFITYSMMIMFGFVMLSMLAIIAPRADVAAGRIDEVLEAEISIVDPEGGNAVEESGLLAEERPQESRPVGATIAFDHVSFAYGDHSECVLQDVSFTAEAGKTCAIIGPTGSGKSTVLKLIERFYDVNEGSVTLDGVDVRNIPLQKLRSQLGYVPQRAFLFSGTIASNVGYGEDTMDDERILEAVDIAQAGDLVDSKSEGIDAEITQGGRAVSGRGWPSPAPSPPTLAPSCSTTASRRSTTRPTRPCAARLPSACPGRRRSSWRSGLPRSCKRTRSSCWTKAAWWGRARMSSCSPPARSTATSPIRSYPPKSSARAR